MASSARIAIVGSGISGSSAAHFLRTALGDNAEIVVFERSHDIGGRIAHVHLDGAPLETGAVFSGTFGRYIVEFIARLGLHADDRVNVLDLQDLKDRRAVTRSHAPLGFWNGDSLASLGSSSAWSTKAWMLRRYGWSVSRIPRVARDVVGALEHVYGMQDAGQSFSTPEMLLGAAGLYRLTQQTTVQFYRSRRISDRFRQEIANGAGRICYGEGDSLNAFASLLCLICATELEGRMFTVREGNSEICRGLLRDADAQVHLGARVLTIRQEGAVRERPGVEVVIEGLERTEAFDAVILATPLESASISCVGFGPPLSAYRQRPFKVMHVTNVRGYMNPAYFHRRQLGEIPGVILTTEEGATDFWGMGIVRWVDDNEAVHKIYSAQDLRGDVLSRLFTRHSVIHHIERDAFPLLTPTDEWPPFVLGPGLYYPNALESAMSSMEIQAIASRNVVNAMVEDLRLVDAPHQAVVG